MSAVGVGARREFGGGEREGRGETESKERHPHCGVVSEGRGGKEGGWEGGRVGGIEGKRGK